MRSPRRCRSNSPGRARRHSTNLRNIPLRRTRFYHIAPSLFDRSSPSHTWYVRYRFAPLVTTFEDPSVPPFYQYRICVFSNLRRANGGSEGVGFYRETRRAPHSRTESLGRRLPEKDLQRWANRSSLSFRAVSNRIRNHPQQDQYANGVPISRIRSKDSIEKGRQRAAPM